jgi:hypothetical protein
LDQIEILKLSEKKLNEDIKTYQSDLEESQKTSQSFSHERDDCNKRLEDLQAFSIQLENDLSNKSEAISKIQVAKHKSIQTVESSLLQGESKESQIASLTEEINELKVNVEKWSEMLKELEFKLSEKTSQMNLLEAEFNEKTEQMKTHHENLLDEIRREKNTENSEYNNQLEHIQTVESDLQSDEQKLDERTHEPVEIAPDFTNVQANTQTEDYDGNSSEIQEISSNFRRSVRIRNKNDLLKNSEQKLDERTHEPVEVASDFTNAIEANTQQSNQTVESDFPIGLQSDATEKKNNVLKRESIMKEAERHGYTYDRKGKESKVGKKKTITCNECYESITFVLAQKATKNPHLPKCSKTHLNGVEIV